MTDNEELNQHNEESTEKDIPVEGTEETADSKAEAENGQQSQEQTQHDEQHTADSNDEADPLDVALNKIEELQTKYKYLAAEFDNYRKRTLKERAELILNGSEKAVTQLLPIIDDMERAIKNGENEEEPQVLREGMQMIYHKTMKMLEGLGVHKMDTDNADFDTDLHEAVAMVPGMGDEKKGKVIDCLTTGYKLNDKVIRHAKVAVGS